MVERVVAEGGPEHLTTQIMEVTEANGGPTLRVVVL